MRQYRKSYETYVDIKTSLDSRIRSYYKITGAGTNRWSAEKYSDDTGINAQTLPRDEISL